MKQDENKKMKDKNLEENLNYIIIQSKPENIDYLVGILQEEGMTENVKDRINMDDYIITQVRYDTKIFSKPPVHILEKHNIQYELPNHMSIDTRVERTDQNKKNIEGKVIKYSSKD